MSTAHDSPLAIQVANELRLPAPPAARVLTNAILERHAHNDIHLLRLATREFDERLQREHALVHHTVVPAQRFAPQRIRHTRCSIRFEIQFVGQHISVDKRY